MATVTDRYAEWLETFQTTESNRVTRPDAGTYVLTLTGGTVKKGTEVKLGDQTFVGFAVQAKWQLDDNPAAEGSMAFPGRFWNIPLLSPKQIDALPSAPKDYQQNVRILNRDFKDFAAALLGYQPQDPISELEGFFAHAASVANAGEPLKFRVRIRARKDGTFDAESVQAQVS